MDTSIKDRLEHLRGELRAERISMGELVELQGLAEHIEPGDVELLEAAGVPEHEEETMHPDDYSDIVAIAVEEVEYHRDYNDRFIRNSDFDEVEFHRVIFNAVLSACDKNPRLSQYEAADISEICSGVENDILHGDIRGTDRNLP